MYVVEGLGKEHLVRHDEGNHRPAPPSSGHRWPSTALPSVYTKQPVRRSGGKNFIYVLLE